MKALHLVVVVLIGCGAALAASSLSQSWIVIDDDSVSMRAGLRDVEICDRSRCTVEDIVSSNHAVTIRDQALMWGGRIGYGVGLAGGLAAIICACLLLAKGRRYGAIVIAGLSGVSLASAAAFVVAMPSLSSLSEVPYGWAMFTYFGSATAILCCAIWMLRTAGLAIAAAPAAPARLLVAAGAVPACPQCAAPTQWMPEYGRHLCERCRIYV